MGKDKRDKQDFKLTEEEEELMITFLEENECIWNKKSMDYRKPGLKTTKWETQAKVMGKSTEHLQGWFKSMRDNYVSLHKPPKSGSGPRDMTDREKWTLKKLTFLQQITVHKPQPVSSVSTATYC